MDQLKQLPAQFWLITAAVAVLAVLAWHQFMLKAGPEASYLDADQPPLNVDIPHLVVPRARARTYPASLAAWPESAVGDC